MMQERPSEARLEPLRSSGDIEREARHAELQVMRQSSVRNAAQLFEQRAGEARPPSPAVVAAPCRVAAPR